MIYSENHQIVLIVHISLTVSICPYHPFLLGPPNYIQCPHKVSSWWLANTGVSMCRGPQKNASYELILASPAVPHILFVLLEWFVRWEVSGRTAAVLWFVALRICTKQHAAFLSSSHLFFKNLFIYLFKFFFFMCFSIHTVILTLSRLGKYLTKFIRCIQKTFDKFKIYWLKSSQSDQELLLMFYCCLSSDDRVSWYCKKQVKD